MLIAAIADSPLYQGRSTSWVSSRQAVWGRMERGHTRRPVGTRVGPRTAWVRYAPDTRVMYVRRTPPADWTAPPYLPLRTWLRGETTERPATHADVT
ncbi:glutamate-cysteine ligase family protein [Streptomyces regalis]|uniref:Uncharacterized protein n=1 Tax=Streptomyces regalis TaxID=68262 RepID=A0A0X3UWW2_9ACTN|nr:hypothetical protein ADL12_19920 [Streptomyces regalis]